MADPIAVARKRDIAEARLVRAATAASERFGVPFTRSATSHTRFPALAAAELVESAADLIERITAANAAQRKENP